MGNEAAHRVAIDQNDDIYVTGYFEDTMDFDPGPGVVGRTSVGLQDIFVAKYDAAGALLWVHAFGSAGDDRGFDICVDTSGNVLVTGQFWHSIDFDPGAGVATLTVTFPGGGGAPDPFVLKLDSGGSYLWARSFGGASNDEGRCIATDSAGNVYSTGLYYNYVGIPNDFDPGPGTLTLPAAATSGWKDIYVSKLDVNGDLVWAAGIVGAWVKGVADLKVDTQGAVYLCGDFQQTVDFDPGTGTHSLTALVQDGFLLRLTPAGGFDWVQTLGGTSTGAVSVSCLIPQSGGGMKVAGSFSNGPVDLDPTAASNLNTAVGSWDIFIAEWDASHNVSWLRTIGASSVTSPEFVNDMVGDPTGNLYLVGQYQGNTDFDPGPGTHTLPGNTDSQSFSLILDPNGDFLWAGCYGNPSDSDSATGVALDTDFNVVVCGSMRGTGDFDPTAGVHNLTSAGPGGSGAPVDIYLVRLIQDFPRVELRETDPATGVQIAGGAAAANGRDFGTWNTVAGPTAALVVHVKNVGSATMTLSTPVLSGADAAHFSLDTTGFTTTLAAGSSTSFAVTFDPFSLGAKAAQVELGHDAIQWDASPFTFGIAGVAVVPDIQVPGTSLVFQTTAVGVPSSVQSYSVTASNVIGSISVTAPADFEIADNASGPWLPSIVLPATGGAAFVRYLPGTPGPHNGQLSHAATGIGPLTLAVSGDIVPSGGSDGGDDNGENDGCSTGVVESPSGLALAALLAMVIVVLRFKSRLRPSHITCTDSPTPKDEFGRYLGEPEGLIDCARWWQETQAPKFNPAGADGGQTDD
ncbi:MAG: choice-of-anchor D domain-containing protein [Planctomycetes bacterium]|nr:choice-of-anchor D domain-containing protein [Planctomycetota bacterium]